MAFSDKQIQDVWEKGNIVSGNDPSIFRKDECGAWIKRDMYGDSSSKLSYGWTIDHISPVSKGGGDELNNLRPLQWENNINKSDGRLGCLVKSNGIKNSY